MEIDPLVSLENVPIPENRIHINQILLGEDTVVNAVAQENFHGANDEAPDGSAFSAGVPALEEDDGAPLFLVDLLLDPEHAQLVGFQPLLVLVLVLDPRVFADLVEAGGHQGNIPYSKRILTRQDIPGEPGVGYMGLGFDERENDHDETPSGICHCRDVCRVPRDIG